MGCTVSGLVLATANDEIPAICSSFSQKITRRKICKVKYLNIIVSNLFLGPDGEMGETPGFYSRDPGSIPGTVLCKTNGTRPLL